MAKKVEVNKGGMQSMLNEKARRAAMAEGMARRAKADLGGTPSAKNEARRRLMAAGRAKRAKYAPDPRVR
jgi:hypothetical protein